MSDGQGDREGLATVLQTLGALLSRTGRKQASEQCLREAERLQAERLQKN